MRPIPTTERALLGRPARRTAAVALVLAAALALAAAAVAQSTRDLGVRQEGLLPRGAGVVVVVDLSLSIPPVVYRRMFRALDEVSRSGAPVGLVVFSDTAYELLPPGTPSAELRPLLRFLQPTARPPEVFQDDRPYYLPDPWSETFRSGTVISGALEVARRAIERDRADASILLISDLHSSSDDRRALERSLARLRGSGIDLRIVPLQPLPENRELFVTHGGPQVFDDWRAYVEARGPGGVEAAQASVASPLALVLAAAGLLALLAANELWCRRLELPPAGEAA